MEVIFGIIIVLLIVLVVVLYISYKNKQIISTTPPQNKPPVVIVNASDDKFANKVVFITGGTSGIGLASAAAFARNGAAHVIVCGRLRSRWDTAQVYLNRVLTSEQASVVEYRYCDVRIEDNVKTIIKSIFDDYGRLDVCFNNAGIIPLRNANITDIAYTSLIGPDGSIIYKLGPPEPTSDFSLTPEQRLNGSGGGCDPSQITPVSPWCESPLATNAFGTFYCLKWELHYIFERQPKHLGVSIISTSSRQGTIPSATQPLYSATKAFIDALTFAVANQVAQKCVAENRAMIHINTISPGPTDTPSERAAYSGTEEEFTAAATRGVPMRRVAAPQEIAEGVIFLADTRIASYITSSSLHVDGGATGSPVLG